MRVFRKTLVFSNNFRYNENIIENESNTNKEKVMLTKRQREVLDFIDSFLKKRGYSPSLEEIKQYLKLSSVSTAHYHVSKLDQLGYIEKINHQARALYVCRNEIITYTNKEQQSVRASFSVPVYGLASAGPATIFAEENLFGYIKVPNTLQMKNKNLFAVQVEGESMNLASINGKNLEEGDFALIDAEYHNPQNGDYVLSVIDDCANLKRFERDSKTGIIRLISESKNRTYKPIYISSEDNYMVNGKIVAVLKK